MLFKISIYGNATRCLIWMVYQVEIAARFQVFVAVQT